LGGSPIRLGGNLTILGGNATILGGNPTIVGRNPTRFGGKPNQISWKPNLAGLLETQPDWLRLAAGFHIYNYTAATLYYHSHQLDLDEIFVGKFVLVGPYIILLLFSM